MCSLTYILKEVANKVSNGIDCHADLTYSELHSILNLFYQIACTAWLKDVDLSSH